MLAFTIGLAAVGWLLVSVSATMIWRRFRAIKTGDGSWGSAMTTLLLYGILFLIGALFAAVGTFLLIVGDDGEPIRH